MTPWEECQLKLTEESCALTRPDNTKEISSVLGLKPDISLLSSIIRWIVGVWHISDGGIRHED